MKARLIECSNPKFEKDIGKKGQIAENGTGLLFAPKNAAVGVQTSTVINFEYNKEDGILVCTTLNSVYTFKICGKKSRKEAEEEFGTNDQILEEVSLLSNHIRIGQIFSNMDSDLKKEGKDLFHLSNKDLLKFLQEVTHPLKVAIEAAGK